ncbi:MAG TPA: hypothetical protein VGQ11_11245 [Candidatus Acidoferrales bacterium]|jgi:hypothetical protein|nr:hypothetical protein [Candidatus Acidoferrales bacterium]
MSVFPGEERRRSGRVQSERPVLVTTANGEPRVLTAFTFSISAFGCAARCTSSLPPGTRVNLECAGKKIPAKISFVLKSSAAEGFELGIAFDQDGSEFWGEKF